MRWPGLDVEALRSGSGVVIDPFQARSDVEESIADGALPNAQLVHLAIESDAQGRTVIAVTLELDVDLVMAPAVGELDSITLRRTERATIIGSEI